MACGVMLTPLAMRAGEKPPDNYVKLMKEAGANVQAIRQNIEAKNFESLATGAASMKTIFASAEQFWAARKVKDAVEFAQLAQQAAADLETAAKAGNGEGLAAASKALTGTCASCHTAHRDRLPDGTYEIK
jgi:hypothetical protein